MSINVSNDILNATTKCPHSFSCLESDLCGERKMCEVSYAKRHYVLVLKSKEPESCPYRVDFGYCQLCECPTHFNIYQMQQQEDHLQDNKNDPF
jgi:hypothetical protein